MGPPDGDERLQPSGGLWGLFCRIRGAEAHCSTPPGFRIAAAHAQTTRYAALVAQELARLPHRYGFDLTATYANWIQTWDRALSPFRSLAFGRDCTGHEAVGLIPDPYYIETQGYADLHLYSLWAPGWAVRSPDVVWRGSVTGRGVYAEPLEIPRVKLALACRDAPGCNVGLLGVHETMTFPREPLETFLRRERLLADRWPVTDFAYHRFAIDIDGHANAWGLLEKLILGCCVLKVASPYEQWFYPRLHAWEHYVPVSADLSDLADAIEWCRAHDARCQWIAATGQRLARSLHFQAVLAQSCITFMATAQARPH